MEQIIKSLMSFCLSVCLSVNIPTAAILIRSWWNFALWFGAWKVSSSLFADNSFLYFTPIFKNFALRPMGTSKRYNSVPVEYNCVLFAPTPIFLGPAIWWCHLNFSPVDHCCHGNEFWDKIDYNSVPVKDNCALFAPIPLIRSC